MLHQAGELQTTVGPDRDRTCDLGIKSPLLYQLSYRPFRAECSPVLPARLNPLPWAPID